MLKRLYFPYFQMEADGVGGGEGGTDNAGNAAGGGANTDAAGADNNTAGAGEGSGQKLSIFDKADNQDNNTAPDNPQDMQVPENYEFKLSEGLTISDELKARFTKVAKEAKLTQAQANALMDMHSETMLELINAGEKQAAEWEAECSKQGLLTKERLGYAVEALNVFGGTEAKQVLIETGAANHPAVMKMLQAIGELIHEDTNKEGASKPPDQKDLGAILFSNSKY